MYEPVNFKNGMTESMFVDVNKEETINEVLEKTKNNRVDK